MAGPFAGAGAPTEVGAGGAVVDAGGAIPGGADVPFHVGVVGEEVAGGVEGDVELVAEAVAEEFDVGAVRVHGADEAAGGEEAAGVAVGVPHAGEEVVFGPEGGGAGAVDAGGELGVVAAVEVDAFAIGAEGHGVEAVLTAAVHGDEFFGFVVLVVGVGVGEAVEAVVFAVFVDHDVEGAVGVEEAVGFAHFDGEFFGFEGGGGADGGQGHAVEGAVLVGGDEAPFVVEGEGDPGALLFLGDDVELFDFEAFGDGDVGGGDGDGGGAFAGFFFALGLLIEGASPGASAVVADEGGGFPVFGAGGGGEPLGVGLDEEFFFAGEGDGELDDEGSAAALVGGVDAEFVFLAGFDVFGDVGGGGLHPVGVGGDEGAVEVGFGAVVTGELEGAEVGVVGEVEGVLEGRFLFVVGFGEPDPLRGGLEGGGEGQEGEEEGAHGGKREW